MSRHTGTLKRPPKRRKKLRQRTVNRSSRRSWNAFVSGRNTLQRCAEERQRLPKMLLQELLWQQKSYLWSSNWAAILERGAEGRLQSSRFFICQYGRLGGSWLIGNTDEKIIESICVDNERMVFVIVIIIIFIMSLSYRRFMKSVPVPA